ncbi:MAG TPA: hypothetical protein VFC18_01170 [Burkholderiales bacterium]|nr:hypothetical protein [Burkholderiales bacterium]
MDPGFIATLALAWLGICALLSLLSGWHALARRFSSDAPVGGQGERCRATAMGWRGLPMSYGGTVRVALDAHAFGLSVFFPLRFLHPPLVIPWAEVEHCERTPLWFRKYVAFYVKGHGRGLLFHESVGEPMREAWSRANPARMGGA